MMHGIEMKLMKPELDLIFLWLYGDDVEGTIEF